MSRSARCEWTGRVGGRSKAKFNRSHRTDFRRQKVGHHAWSSGGCNTGKDSCRMKRRDLERRLRIAGCFLKREGGNHSIWMNPKNGRNYRSGPKEPLAKKILKRLDAD